MEFTTDFITENKLTPEQVTAVTTFGTDTIATLKGEWDGEANKNAEKILDGAVTYFQKTNDTDIKREQGEKYGDYIKRASGTLLEANKTALETAKGDYEKKMKDFKGGEALQSELDVLKKANDDLLIKYADFDNLSEKAGKYDDASITLAGLKLEVAFGAIKPNFPKEVNEYEASAKWNDFKKRVLEKFDIELVDNKPVAVSKENKHAVKDLKTLLDGDDTIKALMKGRTQEGSGGDPKEMVSLKNVPFEVPKGANTREISTLIRDYLAKAGISSTDPAYSDRFSELNKKILQPETAEA